MVPAENNAKCFLPVNHTTKTIHHQFIIIMLVYIRQLTNIRQLVFSRSKFIPDIDLHNLEQKYSLPQ